MACLQLVMEGGTLARWRLRLVGIETRDKQHKKEKMLKFKPTVVDTGIRRNPGREGYGYHSEPRCAAPCSLGARRTLSIFGLDYPVRFNLRLGTCIDDWRQKEYSRERILLDFVVFLPADGLDSHQALDISEHIHLKVIAVLGRPIQTDASVGAGRGTPFRSFRL
jgi:hypothetical protein